MTQPLLKQVSLFFYFAFLDEQMATRAAKTAAKELNSRLNETRKKDSEMTLSHLVFVTRKVWEKYRGKVLRGRQTLSSLGHWIPVDGINLSVWQEFQKSADEDELLAVIWLHVLGVPEDQISRGLGITKGTVRYRASKALRKIGKIVAGAENVSAI